jgi:RNA recognition motif-containing protein
MNIYVGNLAYRTTEEDLEKLFSEFGTVDSVKIITDRDTGRSKGFGFVEMANQAEAEEAIKNINGKEVGERALRVNESQPREDRPRRNQRY